MEKSFRLTTEFLFIPVYLGNDETLVSFECEGKKIFEFRIPMGEGDCSYIASVDAGAFAGKTITVTGDFSEDFFETMVHAKSEQVPTEQHPLVHFSAKYGWINDPNGLVFDGNYYHLYFQHNPFNISWENMSWGHALSRDLLHWEQKKDVLFPDAHGTMFSGCGLMVGDQLWFPYTVAGGGSSWSEGQPFYQGLAISTDGGETLKKQERAFLGVVGKDSRDPKIFWHEASGAYIMVLYLEDHDFGIFRSKDLQNWQQTQRMSIEKAWECPDLLCVPGPKGDRWMFWSSDGFYYWGDFDGYTFTSDFKRHEAYAGGGLYATQTYSGVDGRIIAVPWLRFKEKNGSYYQGAMGIPREYSYEIYEGDYRLIQKPVREFTDLLKPAECMEAGCAYIIRPEREGADTARFICNDSIIDIDYKNRSITVDDETINYPCEIDDIEMILDYNILEVSVANAIISAYTTKGSRKNGDIKGCSGQERTHCNYSIQSIK